MNSSSFWRVGEARRLYLMAVWDETPHVAALTMLPLVLLFTERALRTRRRRYFVGAGICMGLAVLANAFGATMLIIGLACLLYALGRERWFGNVAAVGFTGVLAWLVVSPYMPPSLISTIRYNAHVHGDSGWDAGAFTGACVRDTRVHRIPSSARPLESRLVDAVCGSVRMGNVDDPASVLQARPALHPSAGQVQGGGRTRRWRWYVCSR